MSHEIKVLEAQLRRPLTELNNRLVPALAPMLLQLQRERTLTPGSSSVSYEGAKYRVVRKKRIGALGDMFLLITPNNEPVYIFLPFPKKKEKKRRVKRRAGAPRPEAAE